MPPPLNLLSLGAGVQSSALALMAARGEHDLRCDGAIFADTQAEPASVYRWLDWLTEEIARSPFPFPIHRVSKGDLTADSLRQRVTKDGRRYTQSLIPAYTANPDGTKGHMSRACTYDYKLQQLLRMQRKLGGVRRGETEVKVVAWIGISRDEVVRMKPSREPWVVHRWPLVELEMTRHHCLEWMRDRGYPKPPRSACVYCPYHSNREWRRLRDEEPEEFARAVQFERNLQAAKRATDNMRSVPYLHNSVVPLDEANIEDDAPGQTYLWGNECEGICGV
jgi:hypothetical protein